MGNDLFNRQRGSSAEGRTSTAGDERAGAPGKQTLVERAYAPVVQQHSNREQPETAVHAAASRGVSTPASPLPFSNTIQRAFGRHDISSIQAHVGPEATETTKSMG